LLGDAFLNNYYSIHDYTNERLGFAIHTASELTKIEAAPGTDYIVDTYAYILSIPGLLLIPFVLAFGCVCGPVACCCVLLCKALFTVKGSKNSLAPQPKQLVPQTELQERLFEIESL
jgi:hypothetical protein